MTSTVRDDIAAFFDNVRNIRALAVQNLVLFKSALVNNGVDEVGPGVFETAVKQSWRINACDYVLRVEKDIVDFRSFSLLVEKLQRDLIEQGARMFGGTVIEGPSYWQTLGTIEREGTRLVARASVRGETV